VGYFSVDGQLNTHSYVLINVFIENSSVTFISQVNIRQIMQMQ